MWMTLGAWIILVGCTQAGVVSLVFFSTPSTKPLVCVEETVDRAQTPLSKETAAAIRSSILARLLQKGRVSIGEKSPQFTVKMELVKLALADCASSELSMLIHLEIFDLRQEKQKVTLQEVLTASAPIQKRPLSDIRWQLTTSRMGPFHLAQKKLSREIARRIEEYVLLASKKTAS